MEVFYEKGGFRDVSQVSEPNEIFIIIFTFSSMFSFHANDPVLRCALNRL